MPTKMVWKNVDLGAGEGLYHVDQDLNAVPATPKIERDVSGTILRATGSQRHITQIKKSVEARGTTNVRIVKGAPRKAGPQLSKVTLAFDDHIKRLCVKMSVASAARVGIPVEIGVRSREYLLTGNIREVCPVRIAVERYPELNGSRPRAGHLVYVHANPEESRIYSIVQIFSAIQFYCELCDTHSGDNVAIVATHNPVTHSETFAPVDAISYPLPPRFVSGSLGEHMAERLEHLRLELVELYGDRAPELLAPS